MSNKLVEFTEVSTQLIPAKKKPPAAGKGRPKGAVNKVNKALKDMILGALSDAGGQEYLLMQAHENPTAFMSLIGKVLPVELQNKHEGGITISVNTGVAREATYD